MPGSLRAFHVWPCAALLSVVSVAHAQEIDLVWDAPPSCPPQEQVVRTVLSELDPSHAAQVRLHARVTEANAVFRLDLVREGPEGTLSRTIEATECAELADATAVLFVLAATPPSDGRTAGAAPPTSGADGPMATFPDVPVPSESETTIAAEPRVSTSAPTQVADTTPARSLRRRVDVGATGGVDLGTLPQTSAFVAATADVRWERFGVGLQSRYWFPRSGSAAVGRGGGELRSMTAALSACYWVTGGADALRGGLCGGPELGAMWGSGFGVRKPESAVARWIAWTASLRFVVRIAHDGWAGLQTELAIPVDRGKFQLDGNRMVHEPDDVIRRAAIAMGLTF